MKNDSIVRKQMMLYMATIAIFVAVVCGALTIFYTKHYMAEKREELIQQGEKIAQAYKKGYRTGNLSELSYELQILESYMAQGFWLSMRTVRLRLPLRGLMMNFWRITESAGH